jgi:hypothetical protein
MEKQNRGTNGKQKQKKHKNRWKKQKKNRKNIIPKIGWRTLLRGLLIFPGSWRTLLRVVY